MSSCNSLALSTTGPKKAGKRIAVVDTSVPDDAVCPALLFLRRRGSLGGLRIVHPSSVVSLVVEVEVVVSILS